LILTYTNRKGVEHRVRAVKTKAGRERYVCTTKPDGPFLDRLPKGYEIHEGPNGRVSVRRKQQSRFTAEEVRAVKAGMKEFSSLKPYEYKIAAEKDAITVHLICQDLPRLVSMLNPAMARNAKAMENLAAKLGYYEPMMRFRLVDGKQRTFRAERFCSLGGIDDWIFIGQDGPLTSLVAEYVRHLGQESFYELD